MPKLVDLFCGTGALSYGLMRASYDFQLVAGIDFDRLACSTASLNHPSAKIICDDITRMSPRQFEAAASIAHVDVVVGGPPCQGFSSLRPNRATNTADARNKLYAEFAAYVAYFEPKVFLMENVIGLIGHSRGRLLASVLGRFKKLGYETNWRVVNCANYGVPQKRERFILIGRRQSRRARREIIFPAPTHHFVGKVIGTRDKTNHIPNPLRGRPALTVMDAISDLPPVDPGEEQARYASRPRNEFQRARRRGAGKVLTLHQATAHSKELVDIIRHAGASRSALPPGLVRSGFSSTYSRLDGNEPSTTITVKFTSPASSKCIHPLQHRAITPREAARLQGFDDAFQFSGGRTQVAEQIGNAIPPLLGTAFARTLAELL